MGSGKKNSSFSGSFEKFNRKSKDSKRKPKVDPNKPWKKPK